MGGSVGGVRWAGSGCGGAGDVVHEQGGRSEHGGSVVGDLVVEASGGVCFGVADIAGQQGAGDVDR